MFIFSVIKGLYFVLNVALVVWLFRALRGPGVSRGLRWGACLLVVILSLAYPVSRLLDGNGWGVRALTFVGTFWLSLVVHVLLAWLALRVFRWLNRCFRWFVFDPAREAHWRHLACAGIAGVALIASTAGWINSRFITVRAVTLAAPADAAPLRIVAVSDTHLGRVDSPAHLEKVVDQIVPLKPDLVVFVGDILEYDFDPGDAPAVAAAIRRLQPRLGVWGVLGNHEYIGGHVELYKRLLDQVGIRILIDRWVELDGAPGSKLLLIGRDDRSSRMAMSYPGQSHVSRVFPGRNDRPGETRAGRERKTIEEILADAPSGDHLKILLDHQPFDLRDAERAGVFLQLSGHTHRGQLVPFNLLVWLIYENSYGHSQRGQTHYQVTSGAGTWGPSVRTTGRPEVVMIDLVPQPQ